MGRENYYKPGSWYRVCDRTGFVVRAERTRKEWDGLIVRGRSFELRNVQDFVKGVPDDQTVPEARPKPAVYTFVGPAQSTLAANAVQGAGAVVVNAPFPVNVGDRLAITVSVDLGTIFFCQATSSDPSNLAISPALQGFAMSGSAIANLSYGNVSPSSYGASNGG